MDELDTLFAPLTEALNDAIATADEVSRGYSDALAILDPVGAIASTTPVEQRAELFRWLTEEECFEPEFVAGWMVYPLTSEPVDDSEDEDWIGFRFDGYSTSATITPQEIEKLIITLR